jgi:hypothetical protein
MREREIDSLDASTHSSRKNLVPSVNVYTGFI